MSARSAWMEPIEPRLLLAVNGLMGQYYDDANLTTLKFTRTDPTIDFDFGSSSPLSALGADTFSIRWTGQIQSQVTGSHVFRVVADDGVRLWVRGQLLIDRWSDRPQLPGDADGNHTVDITDLSILASNWQQSPRTFAQGDFSGDGVVDITDLSILATNWQQTSPPPVTEATISLTAGQKYEIKLEYYEASGDSSVHLYWTPPGGAESIVSRSNLFDIYSPAPQVLNNPIAASGADPWVLQYQGDYLYCRSDGGRLYVARSSRLQDIDSVPAVPVWSPPPGTNYSQNLWAPELHRLDGKWYIYFAADNGDNASHRMYVLESNSQDPMGSYTFKGKIAAATDRWAIDGTVVEHAGQRYFVWSGWPGFTDGQQNLYIAAMSNPWTISGDRVLLATPDYAWERNGLPINEGPEALLHDGQLHIIYSASGFWTNDYCLGQLTLTGANILSRSSWTKKTTPVFAATSQVVGVGHASFTKSPDGLEDWIVYHAHDRVNNWTGGRDVRIQPFGWFADASPNFGVPQLSVTEPSGTPNFAPASVQSKRKKMTVDTQRDLRLDLLK